MSTTNPFAIKQISDLPNTPLDQAGSWPESTHVWSALELDALALAFATGRPLLIKGEPGVGKSQIARAAHALLKECEPAWRFLYEVISPGMEARDLLWHDDPIGRLSQANRGVVAADRPTFEPGVLWQALAPVDARPSDAVVLIDEIDKADPDVPNSLLEVLGNQSFTGPQQQRVPATEQSAPRLLVIFTSNDERDLPPAFLRRCLVLDLKPEQDEAAYCEWLSKRGAAQCPDVDPTVLTDAAKLTWKDRSQTPASALHKPGLAEYLDLVKGLRALAPDDKDQQVKWLERVSPFALLKAGQPQLRGLRAPDPRTPA